MSSETATPETIKHLINAMEGYLTNEFEDISKHGIEIVISAYLRGREAVSV